MLGLDFTPASYAEDGSESDCLVAERRSRKPSKTVNVPFHDSSTETAKSSFGNDRSCVSSRDFSSASCPLARALRPRALAARIGPARLGHA